MSSVTERLQEAMHDADWSIRKLHSAIQATGVRGRSYINVRRYVRGEAEPPLEFLRAAAMLLNVSETWLVTGEGRKSIVEESAEDQPHAWISRDGAGDASSREEYKRLLEIESAICTGMNFRMPRSWAVMPSLVHVFRQRWFWQWRHPGAETTDEVELPDDRRLGHEIGQALMAPLEALKVDPNTLESDEVQRYLMSMVPVMLLLSRVPKPDDRARIQRKGPKRAKKSH
jgi:transcriptional regulator with XRE-family HTH domain